jgi:hypothetical protein
MPDDPTRTVSPSPGDSLRHVTLGRYAVCFFDLMGQSSSLTALSSLPTTPDEERAFALAAARTIGRVMETRATLLKYVQGFGRVEPDIRAPSGATSEQTASFDLHRQVLLKTQCFADTILMYFAFPTEVSHGIKSLLGMTMGVGSTMLLLLSQGIPARGSIEVGIGTDALPDEVYGPVLSSAYHLESKVAKWPRLVVGPGFVSFISALAARPGDRPEDILSRKTGEIIKKLVSIDSDGQPIVDYLGEGFYNLLKSVPLPWASYVSAGRAFAATALDTFRDKNEKLAAKYGPLLQYIDANLARWQQPAETSGASP